MKSREILVSESTFSSCGPVCPLCHVAVGVSESDRIEAHGIVWHGACFDRLPVPVAVMAGIDAVLDDLANELADGPDKNQLASMHAHLRRDAAKHRSPIGSVRRNVGIVVRKLTDMQDVPRARGSKRLVGLLASSMEALKSIVAKHIPNRRQVLQPRLWAGLAVGSSGMFYDRRDDVGRKRRAS